MESEYQHKLLVVVDDDDNKLIGKAIDSIPQTEKIKTVFSKTCESALEEIKNSKKIFSLIIADQCLSGMKGTRFLEAAKELSPESTRFLTTSSSEMETLLNAVNKGSIQRYIVKPWKHEDLVSLIQTGVKIFSLFIEKEKLLTLAKKQNAKLFELNCELMEAAKSRTKSIHKLDSDIEMIEKELKALSLQKPIPLGVLLDSIESNVKDGTGINPERLDILFSDTIRDLYLQFDELAQRNGFEMPEIEGDME